MDILPVVQLEASRTKKDAGKHQELKHQFGINLDLQIKEQVSTILNQLTKVAMTDYGIKLFPHRKEKNLYCQAIWVAWTAGYVSAAAQIGRVDLVMLLLSQQVRNSILHKTIHEVIDTDTGRSDRWPGQLWHAGALSCYFYGLFGIHYNENGMTFFHQQYPKN